jgi:hypothetical protein
MIQGCAGRFCVSDEHYYIDVLILIALMAGRLILVIRDSTILLACCNVVTLWKVDQKYLESFEM